MHRLGPDSRLEPSTPPESVRPVKEMDVPAGRVGRHWLCMFCYTPFTMYSNVAGVIGKYEAVPGCCPNCSIRFNRFEEKTPNLEAT